MKVIALNILLILIFSSTNIYSQNLGNDTFFFNNKLHDYKDWFENAGYTQVVKIDSLNVTNDHVILFLGSETESMDTLAAAWCKLKNNDDAIYEELFNRFTFDMEIGKDSAKIYILGKKSQFFKVYLHFDKRIIVNENFPCQTMGRSEIEINLNKLKHIDTKIKLVSEETLDAIRTKIRNYLQTYYNKYHTTFLKTDLNVITDYSRELVCEVTAIDNLILDDVGYFEYHLLEIRLQNVKNEIIIEINLKAKYGSGVIFAPRKTDYKDMEPKYEDYVKKFEAKLKNDIYKLLTE